MQCPNRGCCRGGLRTDSTPRVRRVRRMLSALSEVRTPRQASWFLERLWGMLRWRALRLARLRRG